MWACRLWDPRRRELQGFRRRVWVGSRARERDGCGRGAVGESADLGVGLGNQWSRVRIRDFRDAAQGEIARCSHFSSEARAAGNRSA